MVSFPWVNNDPAPTLFFAAADGRQALSTADDGTIMLWDLVYAGETRRFSGHDGRQVTSVLFSPDGKHVFVGAGGTMPGNDDPNDAIWMCEIDTGRLVRVFEGHEEAVLPIALNEDGSKLLSGAIDGTVRLWDVNTGKELLKLEAHTYGVFALDISPDGKTALSGPMANGDALIAWDLEAGKEMYHIPLEDNMTKLQINSDGLTAYTELDNIIALIDLESGEIIRETSIDSGFDFEFSTDGKSVYVMQREDVTEWDVETEKLVRFFGKTPTARSQVELTPDGRYLLTSVSSGTLYLWDTASGEEIYQFKSDIGEWLMYLDINQEGTYAIVPTGNATAFLWDLTLPIEREDVRTWIAQNRYVREPTCKEREIFSLQPLCVPGTE